MDTSQQVLASALYSFGKTVAALGVYQEEGLRRRSEELAALLSPRLNITGIDWSADVVGERDRALAENRRLRAELDELRMRGREALKILGRESPAGVLQIGRELQEIVAEARRALNGVVAPADDARLIYVVFDAAPGPESGRFVETEDGAGRGVGHDGVRWRERDDGFWTLGPFVAAADVGAGDD